NLTKDHNKKKGQPDKEKSVKIKEQKMLEKGFSIATNMTSELQDKSHHSKDLCRALDNIRVARSHQQLWNKRGTTPAEIMKLFASFEQGANVKNGDPLNVIDIAIDMSTVNPSTITHDLAQLETIVFLKKWEGLTLTDAIPEQLKKMPVIVNDGHHLKMCR
ncbi:hypothetical protein C0991_011349, partial [Blastosporella zonata]